MAATGPWDGRKRAAGFAASSRRRRVALRGMLAVLAVGHPLHAGLAKAGYLFLSPPTAQPRGVGLCGAAVAVALAPCTSALASGSPFMSLEDNDRIFFWQPLFASSFFLLAFARMFWKTRRTQELRDAWLLKEVEADELKSAKLAGEKVDDAKIEALLAEVGALKAEQAVEQELIGWGESSPTSQRTSFKIRIPPTDTSRKFAQRLKAKVEKAEAKEAASNSSDETVEIFVTLVALVLLTVFLLKISG
mmetsp:Transcript_24184/g.61390  ORF Transcript_24184/g.61390 Transcript_24184/m.61390 type:complete len:248 (+) Transcript_24184:76-819(+)